MKTKIQPFKPSTQNLILLDKVLRKAIRTSYQKRHSGFLPTFNRWNRDDVREAIAAYRIIQATEVQQP